MRRLCLAILLIFISSYFTSCKKALRGLKAARTVSKIGNSSSRSYSSNKKAHDKSDSELKKEARDANKILEKYRQQCSKYKKIFDTVYTAEQYNKTVSEFRTQRNKFDSWLSSKNFHYHNGSSSFASKYNTWLEKFDKYHNSYTATVLESQKHRYQEITTKRRRVTVTRTR